MPNWDRANDAGISVTGAPSATVSNRRVGWLVPGLGVRSARLADGSIRWPPMAETLPVITLEGRIEDAPGRLYAHGTSHALS